MFSDSPELYFGRRSLRVGVWLLLKLLLTAVSLDLRF